MKFGSFTKKQESNCIPKKIFLKKEKLDSKKQKKCAIIDSKEKKRESSERLPAL